MIEVGGNCMMIEVGCNEVVFFCDAPLLFFGDMTYMAPA